MSIIYSYKELTGVNGNELLLVSVPPEEGQTGKIKNKSLSIDTLASYISTSPNVVGTLDQVLEAGNVSGRDLIVGVVAAPKMYLKQPDEDDYVRLVFSGTGQNDAIFPDKSGTVAFLSDIPTTGLASMISGAQVVNTTEKVSLIGEIVGGLSVPANTFQKGDAYRLVVMGDVSSDNSAEISFLLDNQDNVNFLDTGDIDMSNATNKKFRLEADFTIKEIGAAGTAIVTCSGYFSYDRDGNSNHEEFNFISENNTTFDTTILNTLDVKASWTVASINDSITSRTLTLTKIF